MAEDKLCPVDVKPLVSPGKSFVAGGVGGVCLLLVGHPLDTVKVLLQTQCRRGLLYRGTFHCLSQTVSREGVLALYRGLAAPLAAVTPMMALTFCGFSLGKQIQQGKDGTQLTYTQVCVSGMLAGFCTAVIAAPTERVKCLLQVQSAGGRLAYAGPWDCAVRLYKEHGICGVYRGSVLTLIRDVPSTGVYFLSYEFMRNLLTPEGQSVSELGAVRIVVAGGTAGVCLWAVALPPDVLKSNFQTAAEGRYKGVLDVFRELRREEGIHALYKGCSAVMLRAFPANAACFLGFEAALRCLNRLASSW